jgi:adenosine deaminase
VNPRTLEILAYSQVAMEICPTSYVPLGVLPTLKELPVIAFRRAGIPVALGADDPLIFGTRLVGQYEIMRDIQGFGDHELADLARQSIRVSAAPVEVKRQLLAGVDAWLK